MDDFIRPRRPKLKLTDDKTTPSAPVANQDSYKEPAFKPPEVVAETEADTPKEDASEKTPRKTERKKGFLRRRVFTIRPRGWKQWTIFLLVLLILIGGAASAWWFLIKDSTNRTVVDRKDTPYAAPKPKTEPSKLSGLEVDPAVNLRPVTAVMIENSNDARPQAGLKDAGVVFEAIAEGGITRFCALFQDTQPDYIGPVRSVRPYYIDWFMPFDAAIAHAGGSPKGLADVKALGAKDLDQFANSSAFNRVSNRYAPHNLYTSIAKLNELEAKKGFTSANFTGFTRKKEAALATPTARSVNLNVSSALYNVRYDYDAPTNSYKRSEGGVPHKDERSGAQLSPKVAIAIVMSRGIDSDGQHTDYVTTGSGKMYVFQDGGVFEGTWSKASRTAQWAFTDAAGAPFGFNPGQTWLTMVDSPALVKYAP